VGWTFFYMFVILKIPVAFALWLVWWATRAPEPEQQPSDDEGGSHRHRHPRGRPPTPPRRGPHGEPLPPPPQRVRVAAGKKLDTSHR
jgi:hypothetical protein